MIIILSLLIPPVLSTSQPVLLCPTLPVWQEALGKRAPKRGRAFTKLPLPLDMGEIWGPGDSSVHPEISPGRRSLTSRTNQDGWKVPCNPGFKVIPVEQPESWEVRVIHRAAECWGCAQKQVVCALVWECGLALGLPRAAIF